MCYAEMGVNEEAAADVSAAKSMAPDEPALQAGINELREWLCDQFVFVCVNGSTA